jgi:hypothetical protein
MKALVLTLAVLLSAGSAFSQSKPLPELKFKADQKAVVTFTFGEKTAKVDLAEDIAGCAYIEDGDYRKDLERRGTAATPAVFELIDAVEKDGEHFVVMLSKAFGNCNTAGRCGASGANSLIWLRFGANFKLTDRTAVTIEACSDDVILVSPEWKEGADRDFLKRKSAFTFNRNVLKVLFEKSIYGSDEKFEYELFTLIYNRNTPENGFDLTSTVSPDSALDDAA